LLWKCEVWKRQEAPKMAGVIQWVMPKYGLKVWGRAQEHAKPTVLSGRSGEKYGFRGREGKKE